LIPQSFLLVWLVFFAFAAAGAELAWLLQSLLELKMLPMGPEGIVCLAAAGVYPALAGFFIRAHRGSAAAELA
jgi:rod shape-determining protein MreD